MADKPVIHWCTPKVFCIKQKRFLSQQPMLLLNRHSRLLPPINVKGTTTDDKGGPLKGANDKCKRYKHWNCYKC